MIVYYWRKVHSHRRRHVDLDYSARGKWEIMEHNPSNIDLLCLPSQICCSIAAVPLVYSRDLIGNSFGFGWTSLIIPII
jgi:hypothetical protein